MGERRRAYSVLVGKDPLRRPRRRWGDNIKMDFKGIVWEGMDWINLVLGRDKWWGFVNTVMNFDVLLTVHLSIFILVVNQLDAQNLFYNKFISCLYMFRAPCA